MSAAPAQLKLSPAGRGDPETLRRKADAAEQRLRLSVVRAQEKAIKSLNLGDYPAARRTRTKTGDSPPFVSSGDSQLDRWTLAKLRAESQRLMRCNPVARAMIRRRTDLVLGAGLNVQAASGDEEFNTEAEKWWNDWAESTNFGEVQRTAYQGSRVDGDCLIVRTRDGQNRPRNQIIEADRICNPQSSADGPNLRGGVEVSDLGDPTAFYVAEYNDSGRGLKPKMRKIDAADCLFLPNFTRASQTRGEPSLCGVIGALEHIDKYVEATVIAARVAACFSLLIKSAYPAQMQSAMLGTTVVRDSDSNSERTLELQPGSVQHLRVGEEAVQISPEQPTTQFDAFLRMMLRLAGTDQDEPLEIMLLDFSQANFHSSRSAMGIMFQTVDVERTRLGRRLIGPNWRWVIGEKILEGKLKNPPEDWDRYTCVPPARPSLDPVRETNADIAAVQNNFKTLAEVHLERGRDSAVVLAQRQREVDEQRERGILPVGVAGVTGGVPSQPATGADGGDMGASGSSDGAVPPGGASDPGAPDPGTGS